MDPYSEDAKTEDFPPPPPIPPNVVPLRADDLKENIPDSKKESIPDTKEKIRKSDRQPMSRPGFARKGQPIELLTNHFKVNIGNVDGDFFHYSVSLSYDDGRPVEGKGIGRKVIDRLQVTYDSELAGKHFAYDGEKTLFTLGPLPQNKLEFTVVLEDISSNRNAGNGSPGGNGSPNEADRKRFRRPYQSKSFKVEISYAARIPLRSIANALRGQESENSQEAYRVLDIILRQNALKQGCLLVKQSFFHNNPRNFGDLGGGVLGCKGFHSSFRTTQGGLSLNMDVSTTMIVQPGPVVDFLIANQSVRDPFGIDWAKAKRTLKNLRIQASPTNTEYKITGLSELPCSQQLFSLKQRTEGSGDADIQTTEITVYDYFVKHKNIELRYSAELPCINVGRPKKPTYLPLELCTLVSLQRYTKALSGQQRASLVEKSRQKPPERMSALSEALKTCNYDADPMLRTSAVSICPSFTQIQARVLSAPKLMLGNGESLFPRNGRWNFRNKKVVQGAKVERWAIVNFSARCDVQKLWKDLARMGQSMGVMVEDPYVVIEECPQNRRATPPARVEQMFEQIKTKLPSAPKFLLCLIPERNCNLYGPWKKKNLAEFGIINQCLAPQRVNDQLLANVLLKINAKLGGLNSMLAVEQSSSIPLVSKVPTIILGLDVSHGSPGQSDVPSIAAVVSSRAWPSISRYRAAVRTQSPKVEMIDSLFKKVSDTVDEGLVRELLLDFYTSSGKRKPDHVVIFRDGVSESQFSQVLNIELEQIKQACKFLDESWCPKFTLIVAQKSHHTRFFQKGNPDNVPPGTVVDSQVCHPRQHDFYICSQAGMIGTTRPTHYHVLHDEIGFSADDIQELVHSLSYVYQRSTTAVSIVSPIAYAHLAAFQIGKFMKFDEMSETSSGVTAAGGVPVPELPKLHENVSSSMFFC